MKPKPAKESPVLLRKILSSVKNCFSSPSFGRPFTTLIALSQYVGSSWKTGELTILTSSLCTFRLH